MSDLIDRQALLDECLNHYEVGNIEQNCTMDWICKTVRNFPAASPWHRVEDDAEFLSLIISEICSYSVKNEMEPDDSLRTVARNILKLLKISTFNNWMPIEPPKNNFENPL